MSFDAFVWAWRQPVANSNELIVLLALADIANAKDEIEASHAYIAKKSRRSPRSVRSAIAAMEASGVLETVSRPGHPDLITLAIPDDFNLGRRWRNDPGGEAGPRGRPKRSAKTENLGNSCEKPRQTGEKTSAPVAYKPIEEPTDREPRLSNDSLSPPCADQSEARKAFDAFNAMAERHGWPMAAKMNDSRRGHINARIRDANGLDGFLGFMRGIEDSDFLMGRTAGRRGAFVISLDFILQPISFTRLMEGYYHRNRSNGSGTATDHFDATSARNEQRTSAMFTGARIAAERSASRDG